MRAAIALSLLAAALAWLHWYLDIDQDDLEAVIDRAGILGPMIYGVILVLGLTVPFNPVSDLLTVTVAALVLDPVEAILATFATHLVALTVNYHVAQWAGARLLDRVVDERRSRLIERMRQGLDLRAVFVLRFALPLTAVGIDVVSYLAGMKRLNFPKFLVVSLVPWTVMSVVYFTSAGALREISPALVLLPAVVLIGATGLLVLVLRRRRARRRLPVER